MPDASSGASFIHSFYVWNLACEARDRAKELSQNNIVNLLIGLYRVIPFPVELIPCDADCS